MSQEDISNSFLELLYNDSSNAVILNEFILQQPLEFQNELKDILEAKIWLDKNKFNDHSISPEKMRERNTLLKKISIQSILQ